MKPRPYSTTKGLPDTIAAQQGPRSILARWSRIATLVRRFARNKVALAAATVTILLIFVSIGAPFLSPYGPNRTQTGRLLVGPTPQHLLGTDDLGRDILSGVIYGTRISVQVGVLAAVTSTAVGTLVGAAAGYSGGQMDTLLMRLTEFFLTVPVLFLAVLVVSLFGANRLVVILIIGGLTWPSIARLVRGQFLSLREELFVEAARAMGCSSWKIAFSEILPNALDVIIVAATLQIPASIIVEAGLSFIGVSDPAPRSLGLMLKDAYPLLAYAWWPAVFPGFVLCLLAISFNLVGDGLNDVLNPRLRRGA